MSIYYNPSISVTTAPGGINPPGTTTIGGGLTPTGANAINTATSELLATLGNAVADQGTQAADTAQEQGYTNEANAYGSAEAAYGGVEAAYGTVAQSYQSAAAVANNNATLEVAAGNLEQYQQGLTAKQTIGSQQAAVAAGGFGASGSALSLLRASSQQAALGNAAIGIQTAINEGGYQEQAASAEGQSAAALAQQSQAGVQAQAVGAQQAAATGAATAAGAAATAAGQSANFNTVVAGNEAATLATISSNPASTDPMMAAANAKFAQEDPAAANGAGGASLTASEAFTAAGLPQGGGALPSIK